MELIRRAVERAQAGSVATASDNAPINADAPSPRTISIPVPSVQSAHATAAREAAGGPSRIEVSLNGASLEANRIVAHDLVNPLRKSFDILRTQVLQAMDEKDFHILGVTSPSPGCGKTVTAINLALSIARQPQRSVVLMDMDLHRPKVAEYLGISADKGLIGVLEGKLSLDAATIQARIGSLRFSAVLAEGAVEDSSKWMTSQAMTAVLQDIRRSARSQVVIVDLPPMLTSDDVMALLPLIDCVLFVTAVGVSTKSEIEDCTKHLQSTEIVRIVLNKASEASAKYAGYKYY